MYYCAFDGKSVCDCLLMYVWYVSVLVYCPTYCGGCLMRQGMLTQWPAPDPMGYNIQSRRTLKYTLVPLHVLMSK